MDRQTSLVTLSLALALLAGPARSEAPFRRGDPNGDSRLDLADPLALLSYLYVEAGAPPCLDAGDANDDGGIDISDPLYLLGFLFLAGPPPPPPAAECGGDPTPDLLGCVDHLPCSGERNEIKAIRTVNSGVEIELSSTRPFPARALFPVLCIGPQEFLYSRSPEDGSLQTLIFTLTAEEFARTRTGDQVTVEYGGCGRNHQDQRLYWDLWFFGLLDRSLLDR